jgi:hypothetical protein
MNDLWDPERLKTVGSIMNRYSEHLAPGHRIRLGLEGDPCNPYRGDSAPVAVVKDVDRKEGNKVTFRAVVESTGEVLTLNNSDVSADKTWEIHPDYIETFRGHIMGDSESEEITALKTKVTELETIVTNMKAEFRGSDLRETLATTVRELAGDMMRMSQGQPMEFVKQYVDRYDMAMMEEFRAAKPEKRAFPKEVNYTEFRQISE